MEKAKLKDLLTAAENDAIARDYRLQQVNIIDKEVQTLTVWELWYLGILLIKSELNGVIPKNDYTLQSIALRLLTERAVKLNIPIF
jgi:hypothetical protein